MRIVDEHYKHGIQRICVSRTMKLWQQSNEFDVGVPWADARAAQAFQDTWSLGIGG
jgi:hypothetical protein